MHGFFYPNKNITLINFSNTFHWDLLSIVPYSSEYINGRIMKSFDTETSLEKKTKKFTI